MKLYFGTQKLNKKLSLSPSSPLSVRSSSPPAGSSSGQQKGAAATFTRHLLLVRACSVPKVHATTKAQSSLVRPYASSRT